MKNYLGTQEITTKRLILREFLAQDSTSVCQNLIFDTSIAELLFENDIVPVNEIDSYFDGLQKKHRDHQFFLCAIQLCDEKQIIGFIRADYKQNIDSVSLIYAIGTAWRNKGYMQEAVSSIISYFMETVQLNRIEAFCDGQHKQVGRVLIRCGFTVEGIMRQAVFSNGKIVDLSLYSIIRDTYIRMKKYEKLNVDNLWITNYRETGGEHLKSIMRMPKDEAINFANHLSAVTTSGNNRYGDYFERYYEKRQKTEEWLYAQFKKHGGNPQTKHPIYFVLCDSPSLEHFYGQHDRMFIKLKDIPSEYISFTPRDSMHLKDMGLLEGTVWCKDDFLELLRNCGRNVENMIINLPGLYGQPGGYIEAHLWNDNYLKFAYVD